MEFLNVGARNFNLVKYPPNYPSSHIQLFDYKGCYLPSKWIHGLVEVENFMFHPGDVVVCGFPRTGTTWMQEIVYQLTHDDDPNDSNREHLSNRIPLLGINHELLQQMAAPRCMKAHWHYPAMPESYHLVRPKTVYMMRNPKDTLVSLYHLGKIWRVAGNHYFEGTFEEFYPAFAQGSVVCGPYWTHIPSFWRQKDSGHILFVFYEDLQKNFTNEVCRLAEFLGISLTDSKLEQMRATCSFAAMKNNKSTNVSEHKDFDFSRGKYYRKGVVGDWKNYLTEEQNQELETMVERELAPHGIHFCYTLDEH